MSNSIKETLQAILDEASEKIEQSDALDKLNDVRVNFLGKKGQLTSVLKSMKDVAPEDRPKVGQMVNETRTKIEEHLEATRKKLEEALREEKMKAEVIDVTLPAKKAMIGHRHPNSIALEEVERIFIGMGYEVVEGPEVEYADYNFTKLNIPEDHPARDVQDTFYVKDMSGVVLRSQTSGAQIHVMENQKPPIKVISPGRVYRNENINARKNNFFHQIEGLYVDKDITFGDLKGVLNEFIRLYFGASRPTRFRSSFFPFTEPSAEVDVQCIMCQGKGCKICSGTGWLEVLGCGMVDVNVLRGVGIDPDVYSGFAFGMGVERLAMLKYAIDDIRLFFNNDKRFLEQF